MKMYRGIIEDNNHPDKNGMCRVRIFGIHSQNNEKGTDDFNQISTDALPWAEVMGSVENGLNSGIGLSKLPRQGTMVWVVLDHDDPNKPIIIGSSTGVPTTSSEGAKNGFVDPAGVYPLKDRLNEPDTNRLVRGDKLDQGVNGSISNNKIQVNDSTNPEANQAEPDVLTGNASYTENAVLETASGHIVEIDDTSGNERIRVVHKSGSYFEFRPDGSIVTKSVGTENTYIHTGAINEHIQGSIKRYIDANMDEIITGYVKRVISGTLDETVSGDVTQVYKGTENTTTNGNVIKEMGADCNVNVGGTLSVHGSTISVAADGTVSITGADVSIAAGSVGINGNVSINGTINLDGSVKINGTTQTGN